MTVTTSEPTLVSLLASTRDMGFTSGALAMKIRVMKMLMSMGERDLAATVGRMDLPTQQNWNEDKEASGAKTDILDGVESRSTTTDIPASERAGGN